MFTGSSFANANVPNMAVRATMSLRLAIAICPMSTPRYLRGYQVLEINRGDGLGTEESCSTMG